MNKKDIIRKIFQKNIGIDLKESQYDEEFNNMSGWDSLKHVQFVIELEEELDIQLTPEELENGNSINKIFEIIDKK